MSKQAEPKKPETLDEYVETIKDKSIIPHVQSAFNDGLHAPASANNPYPVNSPKAIGWDFGQLEAMELSEAAKKIVEEKRAKASESRANVEAAVEAKANESAKVETINLTKNTDAPSLDKKTLKVEKS